LEKSKVFGSVKVFDDVPQVMSAIPLEKLDCLFMGLGKGSLTNPASRLLGAFKELLIVLVSQSPDLAAWSYRFRNVVDYLLYPFDSKRLVEAVNRIIEVRSVKELGSMPNAELNYIFIHVKKKLTRIDLNDILHIASKGDLTIYTKDRQFAIHETMKTLYRKLPKERFTDIHRSYIVNLDHLVNIEGHIMVIGTRVLPIS